MAVDIVFLCILFIYFFVSFYLRYRIIKSNVLFKIKQQRESRSLRHYISSTLFGVAILFFIIGWIAIIIKGSYSGINVWLNAVLVSFVIGNEAYNFAPSRAFILFTERGIAYPGGFIRWQWVSKYEWIEVNTSHEYKLRLYHDRLGKEVPLPFHGLKVDVNARKNIEDILQERISKSLRDS